MVLGVTSYKNIKSAHAHKDQKLYYLEFHLKCSENTSLTLWHKIRLLLFFSLRLVLDVAQKKMCPT